MENLARAFRGTVGLLLSLLLVSVLTACGWTGRPSSGGDGSPPGGSQPSQDAFGRELAKLLPRTSVDVSLSGWGDTTGWVIQGLGQARVDREGRARVETVGQDRQLLFVVSSGGKLRGIYYGPKAAGGVRYTPEEAARSLLSLSSPAFGVDARVAFERAHQVPQFREIASRLLDLAARGQDFLQDEQLWDLVVLGARAISNLVNGQSSGLHPQILETRSPLIRLSEDGQGVEIENLQGISYAVYLFSTKDGLSWSFLPFRDLFFVGMKGLDDLIFGRASQISVKLPDDAQQAFICTGALTAASIARLAVASLREGFTIGLAFRLISTVLRQDQGNSQVEAQRLGWYALPVFAKGAGLLHLAYEFALGKLIDSASEVLDGLGNAAGIAQMALRASSDVILSLVSFGLDASRGQNPEFEEIQKILESNSQDMLLSFVLSTLEELAEALLDEKLANEYINLPPPGEKWATIKGKPVSLKHRIVQLLLINFKELPEGLFPVLKAKARVLLKAIKVLDLAPIASSIATAEPGGCSLAERSGQGWTIRRELINVPKLPALEAKAQTVFVPISFGRWGDAVPPRVEYRPVSAELGPGGRITVNTLTPPLLFVDPLYVGGPAFNIRDGVPEGTHSLRVSASWFTLDTPREYTASIDLQIRRAGVGSFFPVQFGTSQDDGVWDLTIAGDYVYAIASVNGDAPGAPTSSSAYGVLLKLSRNGQVLFQVPFGQGRGLRTIGVAVDDQGFIYASAEGSQQGRGREVFLYKFSPNGQLLWEKSIGTPAGDGGGEMTFSSGYLYLAGNTSGDFPGHTNSGHFDAWIAKLDREGNLVWVKQLGTGGWDDFNNPAVDEEGQIYVTGIVSGSLLGNPYSGAYHDIPVVKFSPSGEVVWARQFTAGGGWQGGYRIYARGGRVYVVGGTHGSLPGYRNPGCGSDAFLVVYDYRGNRLDHYQFGTEGDDVATTVFVDGQGRIFVGGWAGAWCPGAFPGETPKGGRDAFVAQIDLGRKALVWAKQFGGPREDWGVWGLGVDGQGGIYFGGFVNAALGNNSHQGGQDAFVDKLQP